MKRRRRKKMHTKIEPDSCVSLVTELPPRAATSSLLLLLTIDPLLLLLLMLCVILKEGQVLKGKDGRAQALSFNIPLI